MSFRTHHRESSAARWTRPVLAAFAMLFLVAPAFAQTSVISSFANGRLAWSNSADTGYHRIEWASSLTGSWYKTWQFLKDMPAGSR